MELFSFIKLTLLNKILSNVLINQMISIFAMGYLFDVFVNIVLNLFIFIQFYEFYQHFLNHVDYYHKIVKINLIKI